MDGDDPVVSRIAGWAAHRGDVRVVLLTSSRARDDVLRDRFSDYDVMVFLTDPSALAADASWWEAFGRVMVHFQDDVEEGDESYAMRLVLFEDGTKIDFALTSVDLLRRAAADRRLPAMLDVGYQVILDKDGLTARLPAPTRTAHIPGRPSQREFNDLVREFWWETTYVAKNLWREELLPAKYSLDCVIALDLLRRLLEWRAETDHAWRLAPGDEGRGLAQQLDAATWAELSATFVGPSLDENWEALFRAARLFRRIAIDVAERLDLIYPHDLDARVTAYLESVRNLPRQHP